MPHQASSPAQAREQERQAQDIYAKAKTTSAATLAGVVTIRETISFTAFANWYETHEIARHRGHLRERSMLRQLRTYFKRFTDLQQIDLATGKEWVTWRLKTVKASTVNRELELLKSLLRSAAPRYIARSPVRDLHRLRIPEAERRILTLEEEQRILTHADPADAAWLIVALDTLMRLSNVMDLQWAQVKFDRQSIVPLNAKVSHDLVPITSRMADALQALPNTSAWVFPDFHRRPGAQTGKNLLTRRFSRLCALADVPHGRAVGGVTFHCLRHTGASRALANGASVRTVMKLGGWRTMQTVLGYLHTTDADVRAAAESIGRSREEGVSDGGHNAAISPPYRGAGLSPAIVTKIRAKG